MWSFPIGTQQTTEKRHIILFPKEWSLDPQLEIKLQIHSWMSATDERVSFITGTPYMEVTAMRMQNVYIGTANSNDN